MPMAVMASLKTKLGIFFIGFVLLVIGSVGAMFLAIETQAGDAAIINLAGRQRMLVQQMTKDVLLIEKGEARGPALWQAAGTFDGTLRAFVNGGQTPSLSDRAVDVPATAWGPEVLAELDQVRRVWGGFRKDLDVVLTTSPGSPDFVAAAGAIEQVAPDLVQEADDVVRVIEADADRKMARLRWIQAAFLTSALLLMAAGSLAMQRLIVGPLQRLGAAAELIGRSDLSTPVRVEGPREIGILSARLDTMRAQLRVSQEELKAWGEDLEARVAQRTRELVALYEVSREISSRLDINHVLGSVTNKAQELLSGDFAALCLLDETGQVLHLQAASGRQAVCQTRLPAYCQPAALVLRSPEAVSCANDDALTCEMIPPSCRVSHLAAPLRVGERATGALCVGSSREQFFSPDGARLLTKLASSAAIALENARLYEQVERVAMLEERQRIAAEMHDGLAQTLSYLDIKAEQVAEFVEAGRRADAADELARVRRAISQASREVRRSIASLQEGPQPRQAVQHRLAALVDEFGRDGGLPAELKIELLAPLFLPSSEIEQVERVVREALLNAYRHARARHVVVHLEQQRADAVVIVEDDGQGFDLKASADDGGGHFGLSIMRARAARIGGQLTVESAPGQGTRVWLSWPARTNPSNATDEPDEDARNRPIEGTHRRRT